MALIILIITFLIFIGIPLVLTFLNGCDLFLDARKRSSQWRTEAVTIVLGVTYTLIYDVGFSSRTFGVQYRSDWYEVLNMNQLHTPVWTEAGLTIIVLSLVGILGFLILSFRDVNKLPPLVAVGSISGIYLGMLMCGLWIIQVMANDWLLCLFPFNCILIGAIAIRNAVKEWRTQEDPDGPADPSKQWNPLNPRYRNPMLNRADQLLMDSSKWPLAGLILMLPLLGILIAVLVLFGQRPDSVIRAWTETADWNLSMRIAPPNVSYDEHYLCTVAAQGDPKVVKPLRKGIRHGHVVTVNRQLCIANAFEQILEERMPWLHRPVRRFYDTCGFPAARMIRTRKAADVVYILMKPMEWFFLAVLYLVDEKPENRIAVQYPRAPLPGKLL